MNKNHKLCICVVMALLLFSCRKNSPNEILMIKSFDPSKGTPGNIITITGKGFGDAVSVVNLSFNGTKAVISVLSDTVIVAPVPPGAATGKISVSLNGHSAISEKNFVILP